MRICTAFYGFFCLLLTIVLVGSAVGLRPVQAQDAQETASEPTIDDKAGEFAPADTEMKDEETIAESQADADTMDANESSGAADSAESPVSQAGPAAAAFETAFEAWKQNLKAL